jgi:hypothetical protein
VIDETNPLAVHRQRLRDGVFLVALGLMLLVLGCAVVQSAYPGGRSKRTATGVVRAVDPAALKQGFRSGHLSNHEAEHYHRVSTRRGLVR